MASGEQKFLSQKARRTGLPVAGVLEALAAALKTHPAAVVVAPPGSGKTTLVPLFLADRAQAEVAARVIVLEPRRLAARAAAVRMAELAGTTLGGLVGLRARLDTRVSAATRVEVVTEGVFTRMILDDPSLEGVGAVVFDEFHERSLDADLALALARDAQSALRADLRLVVMSATLDTQAIVTGLGAPPVERQELQRVAGRGRLGAGQDPGRPQHQRDERRVLIERHRPQPGHA